MGQSTLEKTLELIEELKPEELRQVQEAIQKRVAPDDETAAMERFHQALLDSGLVKEIKRPSGRPAWDHPPIEIQGEPLSETIIRERR